MSKREHILGLVKDLVSQFTYYDRKEDEDLSEADMDAAIEAGEPSVDEIVARFKQEMEEVYHTTYCSTCGAETIESDDPCPTCVGEERRGSHGHH